MNFLCCPNKRNFLSKICLYIKSANPFLHLLSLSIVFNFRVYSIRMDYPTDFRFRPTDDVIIDYYLRLKHLGIEEGDVNHFITTVEISSYDPWDLPCKFD